MKFFKIVLPLLALRLALPLAAQEPDSTARFSPADSALLAARADSILAAKKAFARAAVMSVRLPDEADTLDTDDPSVKVILYGNYTWRFIKDPAVVMSQDVFSEHWDEKYVDPYRVPTDSLPDVWTVWIVDSLGHYHCPHQGRISSPFGYRRGRRHQGVDLPLRTGEPVYAAFDGKVRISAYTGGYGNLIVLRHENGLETFYGHLSQSHVQPGDWVHAGQVIGDGGSTGRSTGPHLHFETRYKGYAFDPQWLIDFNQGILRHRLFTLKKRYFNPGSRYAQSEEDEEEIQKADEQERQEAEAARKRAEAAAKKYHKIRSGDTLSAIAKKYGTTVSKICSLNGIKPTTTLQVGKSLRVK